MAKFDHKAKIESRKIGFRKPDLGYYYIVTDGAETEPNFLNGIKSYLPNNIKNRLVIKVKSSKTYDMIETILNEISKSPIVYDPWIVFDKDQVKEFDELVYKAEKNNINLAWSNPCIEILFLAYFDKFPSVNNQGECSKEFGRVFLKETGKKYEKNNKDIYNELIKYGDENRAIEIMYKKHNQYIDLGIKEPSKMFGLSMLYKLVYEISDKISKNKD